MNTPRNYQKLKTLSDFSVLDAPICVDAARPFTVQLMGPQMVLRMLIKPRYGHFRIPRELGWLEHCVRDLAVIDHELTGIKPDHSWCYVTVRHGPLRTQTDDQWHFDGASFRVELIPERNYVWANHTGTEFKTGSIDWPSDFDPVRHNLFTYAAKALANEPVQVTEAQNWYLLNPFCLHRRAPSARFDTRTFIRIAFTEIEGRDVNNTPNPLLYTPTYGRDPVRSFRDKLIDYPSV